MPNFYMPTKKRRVGFIPRSDVLDLINKLSFESNLSISKIINTLVEEALCKRGVFNIKTGRVLNYRKRINVKNINRIKIKNYEKDFSNDFKNNIQNTENLNILEESDVFIDKEIYEKFLMFLQFQERMQKEK